MLDWIKGGGNIPREGGIRRLEHCQKGGGIVILHGLKVFSNSN